MVSKIGTLLPVAMDTDVKDNLQSHREPQDATGRDDSGDDEPGGVQGSGCRRDSENREERSGSHGDSNTDAANSLSYS